MCFYICTMQSNCRNMPKCTHFANRGIFIFDTFCSNTATITPSNLATFLHTYVAYLVSSWRKGKSMTGIQGGTAFKESYVFNVRNVRIIKAKNMQTTYLLLFLNNKEAAASYFSTAAAWHLWPHRIHIRNSTSLTELLHVCIFPTSIIL